MAPNRGPIIGSIILFVLFLILLVVSFISGSIDLGLLSAVVLLSGFLAFIDYIGHHPPMDRQNLYTGICFFLLAVAEFLIFMNHNYSDKSRLGWIAFGLFFGSYNLIKYYQIKNKE